MSNELSKVLSGIDKSMYSKDLEENKTLSGGMFDSFPIIRTVGKEFVLTIGGDPVGKPAKDLVAVIIKANPHKSTRYFSGIYNPKEAKAPDCSSSDDIRPDASIEKPQSALCANCPHHAFGGACRPHRRIALCVLDTVGDTYTIYRLDVPAASLKSLKLYGDLLNQHKVPMSAVLTRISFDNDVAYARFNFECVSVLPADKYKGIVKQAQLDPIIQTMLESTTPLDAEKIANAEIEKANEEEEVKKAVKKQPLADVDFGVELDQEIARSLG